MGNTRPETRGDGQPGREPHGDDPRGHKVHHEETGGEESRGEETGGDESRSERPRGDQTRGAADVASVSEQGRVIDRVATPDEHASLAATVGWQGHFDDHLRAASLDASIAGAVYMLTDGTVVGMARAVGDGLQYAYIQDVIVHPDHGDQGIATRLVERLLELLRPDPPAELFVGLFASYDARGVYESLGFTAAEATGMYQRISGGVDRQSPC